MNTIFSLIRAVDYVSAAVILIFGICFVLNNMSRCTKHDIRFAWILLCAGSAAVYLMPWLAHTLVLAGLAMFILADRRRCMRCAKEVKERKMHLRQPITSKEPV